MTITVLTPTYNRIKELPKLYNSLINQTDKDFIWMVIDDGSKDDTKKYFDEIKKENKIKIEYYYKNNGGKHTALNYGISRINTDLTIIVDSDDYLVESAIKKIKKYDINNLCGICFLKSNNKLEIVGDDLSTVPKKYNYLKMRNKIKGDKAEVWVTDILKSFPFPEFENEKFIGESVVWNEISKHYDMLFVNEIIYICEYLDGGLTKSGRKLRISNPLGGMANSKTYFNTNLVSLKLKIKNMWLFICYGKFASKKLKEIIKLSEKKLFCIINIPFGLLLYKYFKGSVK